MLMRPFGVKNLPAAILTNTILLVGISLLFSCHPAVEKKPKDMVPPETMKDILVEMHILESRAQVYHWQHDTLAIIMNDKYRELYGNYDITEEAFKATFRWYEDNPDEMDALYQTIVDELVKREAAVKAQPDSSVHQTPFPKTVDTKK